MNSFLARRSTIALLAAAGLTMGLLRSQVSASAAPLTYVLANVGAYGGEPSIVSDTRGFLYDTTPQGGTILYRSTNQGQSWFQVKTADPRSGDTCDATDQSNTVYECNLAGSETVPLQADVWHSTNLPTLPNNQVGTNTMWKKGVNDAPCGLGTAGTNQVAGASCQVFGVDRQWTTAWIPPGKTQAQARVVLMYHDFYGPSQIWVNVSNDGGDHFGPSLPVMANPAHTPAGATGAGTSLFYSMCNTVPTGIQTVQSGPNAGRIYASWIAADVAQNAGGCNVTMLQSFHDLWVSWSDDGGTTWTTQQAYDGGAGHDASTPFAAFTLDDRGNPYIAFAMNNVSGTAADTTRCAAESVAAPSTTLQTDTACQYNMYVVWAPDTKDGATTWDGGGGLVPGSAATPYQVNPASETGTHFFPAIAVGDPGQVDVAYLRTPTILPSIANGKAYAGGCAGPGTADPTTSNGNPPNFPEPCKWDLWAGQSLGLLSPPGNAAAAFTTTNLTNTLQAAPMHVGDICNLGIFCAALASDRSLLDFISETIDPTTGCAHIAYADNNDGTKKNSDGTMAAPASPHNNNLVVANQLKPGCLTLTVPPESGGIPESRWAALLIPAGALGAVGIAVVARHRRRRVTEIG